MTNPAPEPASQRQQAFLAYMGIAFSPEITREEALALVNDATENPRDPARLARWNEDRLQLHPELFAAELQARKENRPQRFTEICHEEGAPFFEKVTRAHCQVLVAHLDVHAPNWDAHEHEAAWKHFFPALTEKFPQLVTEQGKAKFKPGEVPKPAPAPTPVIARSSPATVRASSSSASLGSKIFAFARGAFFGLIILAVLWVVRGSLDRRAAHASPAAPAQSPATAPAPELAKPASPVPSAAGEDAAPAAPEKPATEPAASKPEPAGDAPAMPTNAAPPAEANADLPSKGDLFSPPATSELIPPTPARAVVILTKPIKVTLAYGKVTVPPGNMVTILQRSGNSLTVRYLDKIVAIPASSTDLGTDLTPATSPAGATAANATPQ